MAHQIADHLIGHQLAHHLQGVGAQRGNPGLHDDQRAESQRQDRQQVHVGARNRLVDHQLGKERGGEHRHLQHDDLAERGPEPLHFRPQAGQPRGLLGGDGLKLVRRGQLQHHAGEMLGRLLQAQRAPSRRRIVDGD